MWRGPTLPCEHDTGDSSAPASCTAGNTIYFPNPNAKTNQCTAGILKYCSNCSGSNACIRYMKLKLIYLFQSWFSGLHFGLAVLCERVYAS